MICLYAYTDTDHAHVTRLHDHPDPRGGDGLPHGGGDLPGEPLLDLEPPAVHLDYAGQLGEPQHLAPGQVADADLAHEGDHVVLAQGEELNVLYHHHLISVLIENCILTR